MFFVFFCFFHCCFFFFLPWDAQGDVAGAYEARKSVADYFEHTGDVETAVAFRLQCQTLAGAAPAPDTRIEASYLHGLSLEKNGLLEQALAAFTEMHALTRQHRQDTAATSAGARAGPASHAEACACIARVQLLLGQQVPAHRCCTRNQSSSHHLSMTAGRGRRQPERGCGPVHEGGASSGRGPSGRPAGRRVAPPGPSPRAARRAQQGAVVFN
jgi:hypothetical protein